MRSLAPTNAIHMSSHPKLLSPQNEYTLRSRSKPIEQIAPKTVAIPPKNNVVARTGNTHHKAFKSWDKLAAKSKKGDNGYVAEVNTIVLAKMGSYRPWPAVILNEHGRTVFWVRFFGKGSHASVKKIDCVLFEKTTECVLQFLGAAVNGTCDDYKRAVREAEIALSIPADKSLLNLWK